MSENTTEYVETETETVEESEPLRETNFRAFIDQIKTSFDALIRHHKEYRAATDIEDAVENVIDSLDPESDMGKVRDKIAKCEAYILENRGALNEFAREEAIKRNNEDYDETAERAAYNEEQKNVKDQVTSLITVLTSMGNEFDSNGDPLTDGAQELRDMESGIPSRINKPGGASPLYTSDSETALIREWALANNMEVGTKGRIKAEIKQAYFAAHPDRKTA